MLSEIDHVENFTYRNVPFASFTTREILEKVCEFQFLPTDIIVATNPRCGTTFAQEIIWQIKNRASTSANQQVKSTHSRMTFLELNYKIMRDVTQTSFEMLESQKNDPYRLIKTHLSFDFVKNSFEKVNPKLVVVMRNVKDFLASYYPFAKNNPHVKFSGSFDEFFQLFTKGQLPYGCYFDKNIQWWSLRDRENVLILFYEDLLMNLSTNVKKIADFLGDQLTQDEVDKVVHNCSFSTMYNNPNVNMKMNDSFSHLRKGIVGDWKNNLTEEQNKILDEMIEKKFENTGLKFIYE